MLIERIRTDGHHLEHSHHPRILLYWQNQQGPDAPYFAQLGVHPLLCIRIVADKDFAGSKTKPGKAAACMQTRPHFWSRGSRGGAAARRFLCAKNNSRSGRRCSLHRLVQNGLKSRLRSCRLLCLRRRDGKEADCAVLSLAWLLSSVGNIWIVGQGEARHTHAFRIVSRPRFSVMRVRLAAGVPQSSGAEIRDVSF